MIIIPTTRAEKLTFEIVTLYLRRSRILILWEPAPFREVPGSALSQAGNQLQFPTTFANMESERSPLLGTDTVPGAPPPPYSLVQQDLDGLAGPAESDDYIRCEVCSYSIERSTKKNKKVITCPRCNESTVSERSGISSVSCQDLPGGIGCIRTLRSLRIDRSRRYRLSSCMLPLRDVKIIRGI